MSDSFSATFWVVKELLFKFGSLELLCRSTPARPGQRQMNVLPAFAFFGLFFRLFDGHSSGHVQLTAGGPPPTHSPPANARKASMFGNRRQNCRCGTRRREPKGAGLTAADDARAAQTATNRPKLPKLPREGWICHLRLPCCRAVSRRGAVGGGGVNQYPGG